MVDIEKQIEKLRQGDISALEQIYLQTKNSVFAIIYSITKNYQVSEDLMQETYLKICKNIHQYKPNTNSVYWINRIAHNLAINSCNKQKFENLTDFSERTDLHTDSDIQLRDESGIFKKMADILNDNEYKIVVMHTLGGIKLKEIAHLFDKSQGTIRWQYNNAIKKLQSQIKSKEE